MRRRDSSEKRSNVQLWAGNECTVNRGGDSYLDQFDYNNGDLGDHLHLLTDLGVSAVRVSVLWERVAPMLRSVAPWAAVVDPALDTVALAAACTAVDIPVAVIYDAETLDEKLNHLIDCEATGRGRDATSLSASSRPARLEGSGAGAVAAHAVE